MRTMLANGRFDSSFWRRQRARKSDERASGRPSRVRRRPQVEGLEARCLLSAAPTITEFPIPTPRNGAGGIVAGPDGNLWFTEADADRIGRLALPPTATTTDLRTSATAVVSGQLVSLTATVTSLAGTPTGTVTFFDGANVLGSAPLNAGRAT